MAICLSLHCNRGVPRKTPRNNLASCCLNARDNFLSGYALSCRAHSFAPSLSKSYRGSDGGNFQKSSERRFRQRNMRPDGISMALNGFMPDLAIRANQSGSRHIGALAPSVCASSGLLESTFCREAETQRHCHLLPFTNGGGI
jgi:hypothetical protein